MKEKDSVIPFIKQKNYRMINNNLGSGSFGKTVLLKDESIDELFVCKKYEPYYKEDTTLFYDFFKREIKIMYRLNHRNIVRIYNYYLYDEYNTGYIIMEYIQGTNIDEYFANNSDLLDSNDLFVQLIDAFDCLEKNKIIHRDIRSSNIMVDDDNKIKVIDFGLGKVFESKNMSEDSLAKEINRMGMEQIPSELSKGIYNTKTDMFCLAELFNRMLKRYDIKNFMYETILTKMMHCDPNKRFDSFDKILNAINNKDFKMIEITESDKITYRNFSNGLKQSISCFTDTLKMETDIDKILKSLGEVISNNCFEDIIVSNNALVSVFVKSPYRYYKNVEISIIDVENFYEWISSKDEKYQQVVINNLKLKLQTIETKIEIDDDDLPF